MKYVVNAVFNTRKFGNNNESIVIVQRQFNDRTQAQEWPKLYAKKNGWTVATIIPPRIEKIK